MLTAHRRIALITADDRFCRPHLDVAVMSQYSLRTAAQGIIISDDAKS